MMQALRANHRQRGFSMLELLLVIVLLALLFAGAVSGISASVRGMHSGEAAIERIDKIRTVQEFLRRQLSRALPLAYNQPQQRGGVIVQSATQFQPEFFSGDGGFMRFVAPMPGYLSRGGAYVQTLQLQSGENGMQLVFTSSLLNGYDSDKPVVDEDATVVLLDHISEGHFSYRGLDDQGNLADWSRDWPDASMTPLMVSIELTLTDQSPLIAWPSLTVPLMMDSAARRPANAAGLRQ